MSGFLFSTNRRQLNHINTLTNLRTFFCLFIDSSALIKHKKNSNNNKKKKCGWWWRWRWIIIIQNNRKLNKSRIITKKFACICTKRILLSSSFVQWHNTRLIEDISGSFFGGCTYRCIWLSLSLSSVLFSDSDFLHNETRRIK